MLEIKYIVNIYISVIDIFIDNEIIKKRVK